MNARTHRWDPLRTQTTYSRPAHEALVAFEHGVWRVADLTDLTLSAHERERWARAGMPSPWTQAPYDAGLVHLGGALPAWLEDPAGWDRRAVVRCRPACDTVVWNVYLSRERWPQCSCCGQPVPCQAELQEREISTGMRAVEKWVSRRAGDCWACGKPITSRQRSLQFQGENLDLPGGITPAFHLKAVCRLDAEDYERRWLAADPARARVLTWPRCHGSLVVHWDGSTECAGRSRQPDCQGHLTHEHQSFSACVATWREGCPRRCPSEGHPGTRHTPLPSRIPGLR